ncbi:NlpC/P60 family protein [Streptomyces sp. WMMC500]|uniref:C40 family peptidase n=1 Tax=Streptomyces sp. WMMC500 TaxID=3015154 RepID=UPI00248B407E|nr:C40 family peptidase [Streptomyces sp. WMMC500]WBB64500.1 NlpC/P60 family protein [Streptomyces sp. WMMC500]
MNARVASHSKVTARAAGALALVGAATATALGGFAQADPRPTPAEVRAKVDRLHHEAEQAVEEYNGVAEKAERTERALDDLRDEAARKTARLNDARNALGSFATAQYRNGTADPTVQLALSAEPEEYLRRAALLERVGHRQAGALAGVGRQLREVEQVRAEAGDRLAELKDARAELKRHKSAIEAKLAEARRLLDTLTAEQRDAVLGGDGHGGTGVAGDRAARDAARGAVQAPNARAARAVAYARGAVGSPYVWGAVGPAAFDCSGLTQAAWGAAGVSLPRTTYTQAAAGTTVPRSALAPGDLVFYYSGLSHVGIYAGGGQIIHAPRPGATVRYAPVDAMPFVTAVRPA